MPYQANYPATVSEVLDDRATFNPAALRAVRELRQAKAWRGTRDKRLAKFQRCLVDLSAAYGIRMPFLTIGALDCFIPAFNQIQLTEKLSVVTFLHEFAHARGFDERQACRWSINLFRRMFPRSFSRCRQMRHMLIATPRSERSV